MNEEKSNSGLKTEVLTHILNRYLDATSRKETAFIYKVFEAIMGIFRGK